MNNLLSQLRGRGATVTISQSGGIDLKAAPSELVPFVRAQKDALLSVLRLERIEGVAYEHSKLRYQIERWAETVCLYKSAGIAANECLELLTILWLVEEIACDMGEADARAMFGSVETKMRIIRLVDKIEEENRSYLTGNRLVAAITQVFSRPKKGNRSALA